MTRSLDESLQSSNSASDPRRVHVGTIAGVDLYADSNLADVEAALRALAEQAKGLDSGARAITREGAIGLLRALRQPDGSPTVQSSARTVDAFLGPTAKVGGSAAGDPIAEVEPAEEPQGTAQLLGDLEAAFARHVVLPVGAPPVLALWVLHTWAFEAADYTPRLALTSPTKRCGKGIVLELLGLVCRVPMMAASVTAAALYRSIEAWQPTLLIDETDNIDQKNAGELRAVLNGGYTRSGSVIRCEGDDHQPKPFSAFAPVTLAGIGSLPDTLADRSVPIRMERKASGAAVARFDRRAREKVRALAPRCARWAMDNADALAELSPDLPEGLNDRQRDIVEPLLAIADLAGGAWPERSRKALVTLCAQGEADAMDVRERLLAAVWALYSDGSDFLTLKTIVERLTADEVAGWVSANKGRPIDSAWLSRQIRRFKVEPRQSRQDTDRGRGYLRSDLAPVVERYLPPVAPPAEGVTA